METVTTTQINGVISELQSNAVYAKQHTKSEQQITNEFLDAILDFKTLLSQNTAKIKSIDVKMQALSWFNDLNNENLKLINIVIASGKDLVSALKLQYVSFNELRKKGIAKTEIHNFKYAISELLETCEDLENLFFYFPNNAEFKELLKITETL